MRLARHSHSTTRHAEDLTVTGHPDVNAVATRQFKDSIEELTTMKSGIWRKKRKDPRSPLGCLASWLLLLLLFVSLPWQCSCYRVGDVVDTIIRTPEETTEALSNQMPLFGVSSNAVFFESPPRFSLAFQDARIPLPWVEMSSRKRQLDELTVTFVYSRSGDGAIHAISSEAKYEDAKPGSEGFRVRYEWVEEEEVDLRSGSTVMFLAVSIASIVILLQTCSGKETGPSQRENNSDNSSPYDTYGERVNIASGAGKWD